MTKRFFGIAALAATLPLWAQETDRPGASFASNAASPQRQLADWRQTYGDSWAAHWNRLTGTVEMLYGGNALPSFEPNTNVEKDWFQLGREWIATTSGMHGVQLGDLVDARFMYLPLGQGNTTDKITVRFDQIVNGVPVEDGRINVLFDTSGRLLSLHFTAAPVILDRSTNPTFDAGFASLIAREAFASTEAVEPNHYGKPQLLFAHVDDGEARRWTLAWQVDAQWMEQDFEPKGYTYTIDARTRQILKRATSIHYFDVTGTISTMATPGTAADHAGNLPTMQPMPYVRVQSPSGTTFTDANGNFTFAGINTPLNLTVGYSGTFTNVANQSGANLTQTFTSVQPNQPNALLMNPTPSQTLTSQANGFIWVNKQRDWIRSIFPNDTTADFLSTTNVNVSNTCNANFNGSATNYFLAGGGCNNTAFSSVVAHEMGHWLNVRYSTGNGQDGMGEGNADVFSMYMLDDSVVGRFFSTGGGSIRNGTNNRQYCGDGNGGCYGQVHSDGEVWMGAAWKVRTRLNTSLGNSLGDMQANLIFLGWMNSYNQSSINSIIETQWVTLDDNDGNIANGSPNFDQIDGGFRQQGFPGIDLPFVVITNVTQLPTTTNQNGPYLVSANMVAGINPPLVSPTLRYRVNSGPEQTLPMTNTGGDGYAAAIPGQSAPSVVEYVVAASDSLNNLVSFPSSNLEFGLSFSIGQINTIYTNTFESGAGGWQLNGGNATTGQWVLVDPVGTLAQPEDDHTPAPGVNCWVTGQGAPGGAIGANDVDGGSTLLDSHIFDLSAYNDANISYWRWYDNTRGGAANSDVFVVQISNNGGSSWSTVETVGPGGPQAEGGWFRHEFRVASFVSTTSGMRLRFNASDLGTGSIVEAAVDDVTITVLEGLLATPTNYCTAVPNTTGNTGSIGFAGSQRVPLNAALLTGQGFPASSLGLFFMGSQQGQVPLTNSQGFLCVSGTLLRLPVVQVDPALGVVSFALDFTNATTAASLITGGSTWNFQFWHRDTVGGMPTSNTSDGLSVEFGN